MRKLFLILALLVPALSWAGTCGNGYSYSRQVTVLKAVGSDQTNFPALLIGTYLPLRTVGNGGQVQGVANNSAGVSGPADLIFCDAASSGNALKFEVVQYSATLGTFEIYVQIPTLHTASFDSVYMFINNVAVVTSQQDLSMWTDINARLVNHFADGVSLNVVDSSGTYTPTNHSSTAATGKIGGAAGMVAASAQYVDAGGVANGTSVSVEAWIYQTNNNACKTVVSNESASGTNGFGFGTGPITSCSSTDSGIWFLAESGGSQAIGYNTGGVINLGEWTFLAATFSGSGAANIKEYVNATSIGLTTSGSNALANSANTLQVGRTPYNRGGSYGNMPMNGSLDEVRVYTDVKSQDWISTSYKFQKQDTSTYVIIEPSYSSPTIRQWSACASPLIGTTNASCPMPFPLTTTGVMLYVQSGTTTVNCTNTPTDSLGLTLTLQSSADFTGAIQHYYECQYTAPIGVSSGADTATAGGSNAGMVVSELKGVTVTGLTQTSTNTNNPASAMTATCAGSTSCFLSCGTNLTNSPGFPATYGTSQGYATIVGPLGLPVSNDHAAQAWMAYGNVSPGSNTCTNTGNGAAGTLVMLPDSPTSSSSVRHRVVNE